MNNGGITGITFTTDEGSSTVSPEAFHRFVREGSTVASAVTAQLERVHVPAEIEFSDEAYIAAPDLLSLAESLIAQYPDTLSHITNLELAILWKKSGGKRGGKGVFGKTAKRGGLMSAFTTADFIIWLAADHVAAAEYTDGQITALLHHELLHIGWQEPDEDDEDGEGKVVLVGHDVEFFTEEVRVYGAWDALLKEAAESFKQAGLFG